MSASVKFVGGLAVLALIAILGYWGYSFAKAARSEAAVATTENQKTITWLISHRPAEVYANAAKVFADELSKESNGSLALKVVMPEDVGFTGMGDIPYTKVLEYLHGHTADISTVYTVAAEMDDATLGEVNKPYRFTSYDDASAFLNGTDGQALLSHYSASSSVVALAFTYSGGFRIIASKTKTITKAADLKGLRVATSGGTEAEAFLKAAGATPVSMMLESGDTPLSAIDAVETTFARLSEVVGTNTSYTKYISNLSHSLFTTMFVADPTFYASLSAQEKTALMHAAQKAALVEQQDSIALNASTKDALSAAGSTIVEPSADFAAFLKSKAVAHK